MFSNRLHYLACTVKVLHLACNIHLAIKGNFDLQFCKHISTEILLEKKSPYSHGAYTSVNVTCLSASEK